MLLLCLGCKEERNTVVIHCIRFSPSFDYPMMRPAKLLVFTYHLVTVVFSNSADHPHRVVIFIVFAKISHLFQWNLPGASQKPVFPMYSGFIDVEMQRLHHKVFYV